MAADRPRGRAGRDGRGSHHIANIAHHFLGDRETGSDGSVPAGCPVTLLAGPAGSALPVRHMLGLGRSLAAVCPGADVSLFEPVSISPSVADLTGEALVPLPGTDMDWPGAANPAHLQGFRLPRPGGAPLSDGRRFRLRNLGHIPDSVLNAWEQMQERPDLLPGHPAGTCLVWCLEAGAAASLTQTVVLGRLVDLLGPAVLEVLVTPGSTAHRGRPWVQRLVPGQRDRTEDVLAAFRETLAALLDPLSVRLTLLDTPATGPASPAGARYLEVAQRLSGQPPAGLAARS